MAYSTSNIYPQKLNFNGTFPLHSGHRVHWCCFDFRAWYFWAQKKTNRVIFPSISELSKSQVLSNYSSNCLQIEYNTWTLLRWRNQGDLAPFDNGTYSIFTCRVRLDTHLYNLYNLSERGVSGYSMSGWAQETHPPIHPHTVTVMSSWVLVSVGGQLQWN